MDRGSRRSHEPSGWECGPEPIQLKDRDHLAVALRAFQWTTGLALRPHGRGRSHKPAHWKDSPGPDDWKGTERRPEHGYCYLLTGDPPAIKGGRTFWYHYHVKEGTLESLGGPPRMETQREWSSGLTSAWRSAIS